MISLSLMALEADGEKVTLNLFEIKTFSSDVTFTKYNTSYDI